MSRKRLPCWIALPALLLGCGARSMLDTSDTGASGRGGSSSAAAGASQGGTTATPGISLREATYRDCPTYFEGQQVLCWDLVGTSTTTCRDSVCQACLCTVRCASEAMASACTGVTEVGVAQCLHADATGVGTCLLACDASTPCPAQMRCTRYPGSSDDVCMFVF